MDSGTEDRRLEVALLPLAELRVPPDEDDDDARQPTRSRASASSLCVQLMKLQAENSVHFDDLRCPAFTRSVRTEQNETFPCAQNAGDTMEYLFRW